MTVFASTVYKESERVSFLEMLKTLHHAHAPSKTSVRIASLVDMPHNKAMICLIPMLYA